MSFKLVTIEIGLLFIIFHLLVTSHFYFLKQQWYSSYLPLDLLLDIGIIDLPVIF